jgi:hypothetical protein
MMMQVFISFILGLVYFFHSSMLAVCTAMRSAPVYMAAIVRSFQRNLFSFFLHVTIYYYNYMAEHDRVFTCLRG